MDDLNLTTVQTIAIPVAEFDTGFNATLDWIQKDDHRDHYDYCDHRDYCDYCDHCDRS